MGRWSDATVAPHDFFDEGDDNYEEPIPEGGYGGEETPPPPDQNPYPAPDYYGEDGYPQPEQEQPVEEGRDWDLHYSPSWFIEEQENRKNPLYEKDQNWSDQQIDAIANYVSGKKDTNPDEWRYGDPGWDRTTPIYQQTIKPMESAYQEEEKRKKAEEELTTPEIQKPQYYAFHNNTLDTTALAVRQEGNDLAPVLSQQEVEKIKEASPYKTHKVDTSSANYDTLSTSGKINQTFMPGTAGTDVKNQKWYQRFTQPVLGAVMSAAGPATVAKLLFTVFGGPAGWAYGAAWAGTAGYSYLKGIGAIQGNEYVDKFVELTDLPDELMAQAQGALAYGFEKAGGGDLTDWSKSSENLDFLVNNFGTIMHYAFGEGKASSEYNKDVVGIVTGFTPNMGSNVIGVNGQGVSRTVRSMLSQIVDAPDQKIWLQRNQTTRNNAGLPGVYEIPDELLGTNAITYWLNYGQYLYDHGITNPKQLEFEIGNAINEVYGDLANYSEFIEHELGDPGNAMEGMQSRALGVYGNVTGDVNLANAAKANTGSLAMDLAGQVPGLQGLIETVGRFAGKEIRSSGGIDEVINTWDMENLMSDPSQLTARDRRLSGINEDGSLKSLDPLTNPNTIKNPFARGAEKIKQLFQTTPEWRASMAGDSIMNFISAGIEDALSARPNDDPQTRIDRIKTFVDELEHPETISSTSPFSKPSKTVLFNSIKEDLSMAIRTHRAEINKVIEDYAKLEPNRQVLNTLADSLGLTPEKVIDKYNNQKTVLAQMIINKADEHGGKIPGIDINVESREFGDRVISMIAPFAGKNAKPYDPRAMMTQITTKIGDGVTETLINKYNIQSEGWVYRFGDTVKKMQQLWLLGLSPSYLANNVVNNVLTRSALGWGGYLSGKRINDWMDRFGFKPERFAESTSDTVLEGSKSRDNKTASERMREAIRAQRKGKNKFLDKVDSKLDWVSDHAGIFGKISGMVEERESRQIYASAMMTYMARTWKPGVNFRKMDPQLENLIRSQNPGMVEAIYAAISSGISMKEIERAIYGTYVIPSIKDTLVSAAQNLGITDAEDVIIEMFTKGGILAELEKALNGKRGDEIDAVISKVGTRLRKYVDLKLKEDIARRADQIANDTNGYGFAEAIKVGQDLAEDMSDLWLESQDANTQLFDRRLREGMSPQEFHALYQEHQKNLNERWQAIYKSTQQSYLGILRGLGFVDQTANTYVDMMRKKDNLWSDFYQKKQPELFQPYLDALEWKTGETFEQWDSRVKKAWKEYLKASNAEYGRVVQEEQKQQIAMDKVFADGLKTALGNVNAQKVTDVIIPLQEQIRNKRQEIINLNLEIRSVTDKTNVLNEKSQVYHENDARRTELKKQYLELQQKLYDEIRALGPQTEAPAADSVNVEVDHDANIRNDITQREAEAEKKIAEQLSNLDTDSIDENGADIDETYRKGLEAELEALDKKNEEILARINALTAENNLEKNLDEIKRLNNELAGNNIHAQMIEKDLQELDGVDTTSWSAELNRKSAYTIARNLGADDELALAYTKLNKIHDTEWETNHPGRKYKDVGNMTVKYTDENRTTQIQGDDGKMYQISSMTKADIDTDEFRNFYGNSPEMFKDGEPIVVYHGSPFDFNEFSKGKQGWNGDGAFWFSESKPYAEGYATTLGKLTEPNREIFDNNIEWEYERLRSAKDGYTQEEFDTVTETLRDHFKRDRLYGLRLEKMTDAIVKNALGKELSDDDFYALKAIYTYIEPIEQNKGELFGYVLPCYISLKNPLICDYDTDQFVDIIPVDYSGEPLKNPWSQKRVIDYAKANGYDGVIFINNMDAGLAAISNYHHYQNYGTEYGTTAYAVFEPNQIKSIYNIGTFDQSDENIYFQKNEQRIKGQFSIKDGQKLVELFRGSDISTLIHETMGHGWATTLNDNQVEALAAYNGWTAERYRQLENQWYNGQRTMSAADRQAWIDAQEKFAYGFEQYLLEGKAPNDTMKQIFETFRRYLLAIYQSVRSIVYKGQPIDIHQAQHGVTLAEIFDSMLVDSNRQFNIDREGLTDVQSNSIVDESGGYAIPESIRQFLMTDSAKRGEKIKTMKADAEESMRQETQAFLDENKKWGLTPEEQVELVTEIMHSLGLNIELSENMDLMASVQEKMNRFPGGEKAVKRFIEEHRATASKISDTAMDAMLKNSSEYQDTFKYVLHQVESKDEVKNKGDFVVPTEEFQHGEHTIDRMVYHNSEVVAYLPKGMESYTIDAGNGKTAEVIGVSVQHPDQRMYVYEGEIFEEPKPEKKTENINYGDAESDSLGALDPEAQAISKMTYDKTLPILREFGRVYKTALNDAMAKNKFGSLDAKTKEMVRRYIDYDVRTDLQNTKYKTGKFGEMMRDAALLNYSKRYGFDNALTLLFPYQFWNTRSAWNWIQRMGGKGGKMWRRYARLKELEDRNKKEIMPSRITGKIGIYLPFLPDWMGDALFMPTSQLSIVGNFMDPLDDWLTDNKAVTATAERYIQEAFDAQDISLEEYQIAMDPAKRNGSAAWQEAYARAQTQGDHDRDLGNLFKQYFGMSLPVSIGKAIMTGNPDEWTQTPMSRTGTAFRALFGDNILGNGLEKAMSAPERALRKAAVAVTGNNDFRYQEFGNWGDYYIRNQVWDMVVEGKISAEDAVEACAEKDGNRFWEEAADRQRDELLQKTQLLSATMPFKKMVEDVRNGNQDKLGDDFKYVLASALTMWTPTSVVRSAERTWREDKAEMNKLYETNDKEGREKFFDSHDYYQYNNLRYEADPEQALRSYLYKSITDRWYDLDKSEQNELKLAFGTDFQRSILDKETRAYQTMDLDRLAAYAQALNGSIPYLATEKLNTMNVPRIRTNVVPMEEKVSYETYLKEREKLHPGMADVSNIYYQLPVEDRKIFRQKNPGLTKYWEWNTAYKKQHPEVANFSKRMTDYYNTLDAENVFSILDQFTIKELTKAAYTKGKVDDIYQSAIERAMMSAGVTDSYKDFVKVLTDYILGE